MLRSVREILRDPSLELVESVQTLWSGYGELVRIQSQASGAQFIVKSIDTRPGESHPRGWNSETGHLRKLRSYQVEVAFYAQYATLDAQCRVPQCVAHTESTEGSLLILEDLHDAGFHIHRTEGGWTELKLAIRWLAYFHAKFIGHHGKDLWPTGTYWHLGTRQEELDTMPSSPFKTDESPQILRKGIDLHGKL